MKKVLFALSFAILALFGKANAQLSVNINIGNQPQWGPSGYNATDAPYYYLPSINCYYDVARSLFIVPSGNRWKSYKSLPGRYKNVNLYNTYKVVVNRKGSPYRNNVDDRRKYAQYQKVNNQQNIRDWKSNSNQNNNRGNNNGRKDDGNRNGGNPGNDHRGNNGRGR